MTSQPHLEKIALLPRIVSWAERFEPNLHSYSQRTKTTMSYYDQFKYFDPLKGKLPFSPFHEANWIASRARGVLYGRSDREIRLLAEDASQLIDIYFDQEKDASIEMIKTDGRYELLDGDEDGRFYSIKDEAHDHYDIRTSENTSDLDALQEAVGSFFDPTTVDVNDVKEYEYFAILALWLVGDYAKTLELELDFTKMEYVKREPGTLNAFHTARLGQSLIAAMEAVCYAEGMRDMVRTRKRYDDRIHEIQQTHKPVTDDDIDRIRAEILQQVEEVSKARQVEHAKELNRARHQPNNAIRKQVLDQWETNTTQFPSAEKAGAHYVDVLAKQGIEREHRTVVGWIRTRARELGIRFR